MASISSGFMAIQGVHTTRTFLNDRIAPVVKLEKTGEKRTMGTLI
jgi:hypothetical protein